MHRTPHSLHKRLPSVIKVAMKLKLAASLLETDTTISNYYKSCNWKGDSVVGEKGAFDALPILLLRVRDFTGSLLFFYRGIKNWSDKRARRACVAALHSHFTVIQEMILECLRSVKNLIELV